MKSKLLVVDDELFVRELLAEYFTKMNYEVRTAGSAAEALRLVGTESFNAALVDLRMPDGSGIDLLYRLKTIADDLSVIMMTGYPTVDTTVSALRAGAHDFVVKPFRLKELDGTVKSAVAAQQHYLEVRQLRERVTELETRVSGLKKREERETAERTTRRFTIIEKGSDNSSYQLEQPVLAAASRRRNNLTRETPTYDEVETSRHEFRGQAITLMEETS